MDDLGVSAMRGIADANAYDVCGACACHIKRHEPCCPFCGALHARADAPRRPASPRVSRARWLTLGSTLSVLGCTEGTSPSVGADALGATDATTDARMIMNDSSSDAASAVADGSAGASLACPADWACFYSSFGVGSTPVDASLECAAGSFPCAQGDAGLCCDTRTQVCTLGPVGALCIAYDAGAVIASCTSACSVCGCLYEAGVAITLTPQQPTGCGCSECGGALTTFCYACYGAPPARLERLA